MSEDDTDIDAWILARAAPGCPECKGTGMSRAGVFCECTKAVPASPTPGVYVESAESSKLAPDFSNRVAQGMQVPSQYLNLAASSDEIYVDGATRPDVLVANSQGNPDSAAEDRFGLAAGENGQMFAADPSVYPRDPPRERVHVTSVETLHDMESYQYRGRPARVRMRVEFELPPTLDSAGVFEQIKRGDFLLGGEPDRRLEEAREQIQKLRKEVEALKVAERSLLKLRQRMGQAAKQYQDVGAARETYEGIVRRWANRLAEGASFTSAEGAELVTSLVGVSQFAAITEQVRQLERLDESEESEESEDSMSSSSEDHLF